MKKIILIIIILGVKLGLNAQVYTYTYKGNSSIGINGNYTDLRGVSIGAEYNYYKSTNLYYKVASAYEFSNYLNMKHSSFMTSVGAMYILPLEYNTEKMKTAIGGSIMASYDMLDQKSELGSNFKRNSFNIGAVSTLEQQYYLSQQFALYANANINYNPVTEFSTFKWWLGFGFKYNF